jgi:ornithine carbamoyltransferase
LFLAKLFHSTRHFFIQLGSGPNPQQQTGAKMVRHFLKDDDITAAEQAEILSLARKLKADPYSARPFAGPQTVALIFDKTSTRTRVSFSVGVSDLGGVPMVIDTGTSQMGKK